LSCLATGNFSVRTVKRDAKFKGATRWNESSTGLKHAISIAEYVDFGCDEMETKPISSKSLIDEKSQTQRSLFYNNILLK
jgi:hypothetical protein